MPAGNETLNIILNLLKKGTGGADTKTELTGVERAAQIAGKALMTYVSAESVKATYELAKMGAQSLRTKAAFEAISGGSQQAAVNLAAMRDATRGAMSETEMMAHASRLLQMGLVDDSESLGKVTEMAVRLGSAMGMEAGPALENFTLMLANQSIPRLDSYGISGAKVRQRILELQAATEGMSREEAFMIATMEEGEAAMGRLGDAAEDEMLAFEQLEASAQDLKMALAEALAPAVAGVTSNLADAVIEMNRMRNESDMYIESLSAQTVEQANVIAVTQGQQAAFEFLEASYSRIMQSAGDAAGADQVLTQRVQAASQATMEFGEASDTTAGSLDELSTSASKVAKSFGEMTFDNETLWNMAMASGASIDSLSVLAQHLGIATDAEIQNTMEAYRLVEAFGSGQISAEQLEAGFDGLAMSATQNRIAMADAAGELEHLRGGMAESVAPMGEVQGGLSSIAAAARRVAEEARRAREQVEALSHAGGQASNLEGAQQQYQRGTSFAPGGWALVGEGTVGGEMVFLPRGSQVLSAPDTRRMMQTNHFGGDTIIVNDRMAAALLLDRKRRQRQERFEGRM